MREITSVLERIGATALALAVLALASTARADPPPAIARALDAPAWPRAPLLEPALASTGAELAWARHATLGEGATICLVDTGVDLRHRDLRDADGRTRVAWLVDLEGAPRGEQPDLESRHDASIWSAAAIDAAIAAGDPTLPGDRHGHGTALASIAAGDDSDAIEPGPLAGIAPRARLIVVRALRAGMLGFEDPDVLAGVELCFALAGRGDAPTDAARTVALVALGNHDGGHDGTSELERGLAAIASRGHPILVAAGNDGARAIHASGRGLRGAPARVTVHVPFPRDAAAPYVALAIRTRSPLSITSPRGARLEAVDGARRALEHDGGYLIVDRADPAVARVVVGGDEGDPIGGDYAIDIAEGPFDAWIVGAALGAALGAPSLRGDHALSGETVTIPATEPALIAVAAITARPALAMITAEAREDGSATTSSIGPSPGSLARPDLAAPGALLSAALSSDLVPDDASNLIGGSRATLDRIRVGDDRIAIQGSSAATAVVAGAYALALSLGPSEPARDRALLLATATLPDGEAWTPSLGHGALRIDRWLDERMASDRTTAPDPASSALSLTRAIVLPGRSHVVARARLLDASGAPVHGGELVIRARGTEIARAPIAHGIASAEVDLELVAGERATIETIAGARSVEARVDEGPRGTATLGGGGCAIAPARSADATISLLAITACSLLARARVGTRARADRARRRRCRHRPGS